MTVLTATQADVKAVLGRAAHGDTVRLVGAFPSIVRIEGRSFKEALLIDASEAALAAVMIRDSVGVRWAEGRFRPKDGRRAFTVTGSEAVTVERIDYQGDGLVDVAFFDNCKDVAFLDNRLIRPRGGVAFRHCDDVCAAGNRMWGWSANGVSLEEVLRGLVTRNEFLSPLRIDDTHIDGVQGMQSLRRPNQAIEVSRNFIAGFDTQGVLFNWKAGYLQPVNIRILENEVMTGDAPNGLLSMGDPEGEVCGNVVSTLPGSKWQTQIRTDAPVCTGNTVAAYDRWAASAD